MHSLTTTKSICRFFILALVACTLTANLSLAQDSNDEPTIERNDRGLFLGIGAGFGGSAVNYKDDSRSIFEDPSGGGMGSLSFGYAFSPKFALSLEGYGFGGGEDDNDETGLGGAFLVATWHPCGSGFFVRVGAGGGGGTVIHPVTGKEITIEDRGAGIFGLGYDWWVGQNTTLGLSVDSMSIDAGGATGFEDDNASASGVTLQFKWYL